MKKDESQIIKELKNLIRLSPNAKKYIIEEMINAEKNLVKFYLNNIVEAYKNSNKKITQIKITEKYDRLEYQISFLDKIQNKEFGKTEILRFSKDEIERDLKSLIRVYVLRKITEEKTKELLNKSQAQYDYFNKYNIPKINSIPLNYPISPPILNIREDFIKKL